MTTDGLPLKLVVEATRGAVIAVHAAGGLARGHAQALRLLRAAEGLCRSAVAVLQTDSSDPKKAWKAKGTGKGATVAREAEGTGKGAKVARGAKDNDKKDTGKRMDKDSDVNMVAKPGEPGAQPRRRRRRRRRRGRAPTGFVAFDPGSMTAGRMEFIFRRLPMQSHFLLAPLLELKRAQFLMMLMFDGAGRSSLGARGRLRGLLARLACLRGASRPLQLLVGLALWRCLLGMSPASRAWCQGQSWMVSLSSSRRWTLLPAAGFVVSTGVKR